MGRNNTRRTWDIPDDKLTHSTRGNYGKVSDVADKFAQMKVSYVSQNISRPLLAGGLHNRTDFLGQSNQNLFGRGYTRKVAG